jgi:hypothetical protein
LHGRFNMPPDPRDYGSVTGKRRRKWKRLP